MNEQKAIHPAGCGVLRNITIECVHPYSYVIRCFAGTTLDAVEERRTIRGARTRALQIVDAWKEVGERVAQDVVVFQQTMNDPGFVLIQRVHRDEAGAVVVRNLRQSGGK
jgi:hypothetical protein